MHKKISYGLSLIHMYSCKAQMNILVGDTVEAKKSLERANKIRRDVNTVPWQLSHFYRSQVEYNLCRLEESIKIGNKIESLEYRKKAIKSCKMLRKVSLKVAQHRTEAFRLIGVYYWLIKKRKKALNWWNNSIKEGERLGARLELARTYFEVGKRLLEAESGYKMLKGIRAEEYLEKARVLFKEMDLQWDLDELDKVLRD